jgi:hypothetical protein
MAEANEKAASNIIASFKALPTPEARQAVYVCSSRANMVMTEHSPF